MAAHPSRDSIKHTHLLVVADRSGSMQAVRDDAIGGFNAILEDQRKLDGRATLTFVQFDSEDPFEVVHLRKPLADVPPLTVDTFVPRGSTPLLDAIGRALNELDVALGKMPGEERPEQVLVALISDGRENASREFGRSTVRTMIEERYARPGWEVKFLCWGPAALEEAESLGIRKQDRLAFTPDAKGVRSGLQALSDSFSVARSRPRRRIGFPSAPKEEDG